MQESYPNRRVRNTTDLSDEHARRVFVASAVDTAVGAERGLRTITRGRDLPSVYSWRQRRRGPGILATLHRPDGRTSHIFRPDAPDPENPGAKYLQAPKKGGGDGNVLDVLEREKAGRLDVPVVFTEGWKKGDSITSAGRREGIEVLAATISGVWNWKAEGEPIPDMYDVPVDGRVTFVCYDSDMLRNPNVQEAAEQLAEHLAGRGAEVRIVYLEDQADGSKTGADDFIAGGGTLAELLDLSRPFDPEDLHREKLSRSGRLRLSLDWLKRREEEMPAASRRECSKAAAYRACVTLALKWGETAADGVKVAVPAMTGAELAGVSQPTFSACLRDLAEDGLIRRIERERREQALAYVLLVPGGALSYKNGGDGPMEESGDGDSHPGYKKVPPLPELRWSSPGRKGKRGVARGTRKVRQGKDLPEDVPAVRRPGKRRQEIIRYLLRNGGAATREELLERFGSPRATWRDFKRRALGDLLGRRRQYRGEPLSVGPPIVGLDADGIHLVPDWREALMEHRRLGDEDGAAVQQKIDHLRQRAGYREHLAGKNPPSHHPANHDADGWTAELSRHDPDAPGPDDPAAGDGPPDLSPLAAAVALYLHENPQDADQPPGWLGSTVWALELHPDRPTPAEARDAVEELGGGDYLRRVLAGEPAVAPAMLVEDFG